MPAYLGYKQFILSLPSSQQRQSKRNLQLTRTDACKISSPVMLLENRWEIMLIELDIFHFYYFNYKHKLLGVKSNGNLPINFTIRISFEETNQLKWGPVTLIFPQIQCLIPLISWKSPNYEIFGLTPCLHQWSYYI